MVEGWLGGRWGVGRPPHLRPGSGRRAVARLGPPRGERMRERGVAVGRNLTPSPPLHLRLIQAACGCVPGAGEGESEGGATPSPPSWFGRACGRAPGAPQGGEDAGAGSGSRAEPHPLAPSPSAVDTGGVRLRAWGWRGGIGGRGDPLTSVLVRDGVRSRAGGPQGGRGCGSGLGAQITSLGGARRWGVLGGARRGWGRRAV